MSTLGIILIAVITYCSGVGGQDECPPDHRCEVRKLFAVTVVENSCARAGRDCGLFSFGRNICCKDTVKPKYLCCARRYKTPPTEAPTEVSTEVVTTEVVTEVSTEQVPFSTEQIPFEHSTQGWTERVTDFSRAHESDFTESGTERQTDAGSDSPTDTEPTTRGTDITIEVTDAESRASEAQTELVTETSEVTEAETREETERESAVTEAETRAGTEVATEGESEVTGETIESKGARNTFMPGSEAPVESTTEEVHLSFWQRIKQRIEKIIDAIKG